MAVDTHTPVLLLLLIFLQLHHTTPQNIINIDTEVSTLAGSSTQAGSSDGDFTSTRFTNPTSVTFNSDYSIAIMSDQQACLIRKVNMITEIVSTFGGSAYNCTFVDGIPDDSRFSQPRGVAYSPDDAFVLAVDQGGAAIRRYAFADNTWDTVVTAASGVLKGAYDITIDRYGSFALVTEQASSIIIQFSLEDWSVYSVVCGVNGTSGFGDSSVESSLNFLHMPSSVILSRDSSYALFTDNNAVRRVSLSTGEVRTLVGNGTRGYADGNRTSGAMFSQPGGLAFLLPSSEQLVVVVDTNNHCLRQVHVSSGAVTTLAGDATAATTNGKNTDAQFDIPLAIAMRFVGDDESGDEGSGDDDGELLDYALITEDVVIRKATFLYTVDESRSSSKNTTIFGNVFLYLILAGFLLGGLVVYYLYEYYLEKRRGVKYKMVKRRIEIRSMSHDNLNIEDGSRDEENVLEEKSSDGDENDNIQENVISENENEDSDVNSPLPALQNNATSREMTPSSHNHLLGPPPKRNHTPLVVEKSNTVVSDQKISSPRPTGDDVDEKASEYTYNQLPNKSIKSKSTSKSKSKSKKLNKEKKSVDSKSFKDLDQAPKTSFWLSGSKDKKKKDKKTSASKMMSTLSTGGDSVDSKGGSSGSNTHAVKTVNRSSGSVGARSAMRAMSITSTNKDQDAGSATSLEPARNLELQREKFEERKREKLLKERDRLEKIALATSHQSKL